MILNHFFLHNADVVWQVGSNWLPSPPKPFQAMCPHPILGVIAIPTPQLLPLWLWLMLDTYPRFAKIWIDLDPSSNKKKKFHSANFGGLFRPAMYPEARLSHSPKDMTHQFTVQLLHLQTFIHLSMAIAWL